jgi:transposase
MRVSYDPVMRCEKIAVTDTSFRQHVVIEFLVKEENSAAVIHERLRAVYGDVCMGVSSVRRWVKHFKDENTDITDQPRCGRPIGMQAGRLFGKKGKEQCSSLRSDAPQTSSCAS